jgi:hypothetical protein
MQHRAIPTVMLRSSDQWAFVASEPLAGTLLPPRLPRASGLSGRPTCRIYARGEVWVLELEAASGGWMMGSGKASRRRTFPTLPAAIGYAERHGLDYRIERPRQRHSMKQNKSHAGRLPRSWQVRLARNGRKGDIYRG